MSEITFIAAIVGILAFAALLAFVFRKNELRDARTASEMLATRAAALGDSGGDGGRGGGD